MSESGAVPQGTLLAERFTIERALGRGAFGRTLLASDGRDGALRTLKLLDPTGGADWKARELFEREAATLRALRHRGIPEVFEVVDVELNGRTTSALVLEYIEGESLAETIAAARSIDGTDSVRLFLELLDILEYLHARVPPILHRDIKPANVILRADGSAALVDFGSVRNRYHGADDPGSTVAGTFGYMPYEQYMGHASPSSDLFSLGATFLHLLTGRPPRDFMSAGGNIEVPADLPGDPRLAAVIRRLLRASPAERFPSARDVRMALLAPSSVALTTTSGGTQRVVLGASSATLRHTSEPDAKLLEFLTHPSPRPLDTRTLALARRLVPSISEYMDTSRKPHERISALARFSLLVVSVTTVGIYPLVFNVFARRRRRRVHQFLRGGTLASARVTRIETEKTAFEETISRVHYEYEADGALHRDSDQIVPSIAHRLEKDDSIPVLYIAGEVYDSVVIAT